MRVGGLLPPSCPPPLPPLQIALGALRLLRTSFDMATGYGHDMNERKYLLRFVFLETIAGEPCGMPPSRPSPPAR